ncbi:conserved hypothetical protein [Pyrobaculum islandicum DSM 4184]|uniref:Uncharacterized protein n=1 Tax=Pyrobaculum islandicum (strain DSM 4184 / JCM 9189 / GEO3) TaxID=384616 RepID=A1RST4_PYRIL|nr:hypothetical protein [Pyrobaculum islandicum]ABL88016.1 conserved hypothetical protein [Pyrobaculum islandicum DSM 4184]
MVDYVEVGIGDSKASVRLVDVTFVTGVGKSTFLEVLYRVISNIGKKIPKIRESWSFYAQSGDISYSIVVNKWRVRQTISVKGEDIVFEYIPSKPLHRLIKPIEVTIAEADVIIPNIKTEEHLSIVAEEDINRFNSLLATARKSLGIKIQMLGPYISPKSLVDANARVNTLDRYARNLAGVLSYLALYRPSAYDSIRASLKRVGVSLSVGLAKPGKIGAFVISKGLKMPLSKAPCSIKSLLALTTALEIKPNILLIDNFDYCMTRKTAETIAMLLRQKPTRVVAEIHNEGIVDWFDIPNKSVVEVML